MSQSSPPPAGAAEAASEARLLALSPLDGRYAGKVDPLRPIFSEYGLIRARIRVEVEWLLALAAEPAIVELPPLAAHTLEQLEAVVPDFGVVGNPVDVTATGGVLERTTAAMELLAADPSIDTVMSRSLMVWSHL